MITCPVCQASVHAVYFPGPPPLTRCSNCGLIFQNPMPDAAALAALYDGDYYEAIYPERILAEQKRMFGHRLERLERLVGRGGPLNVLEIGSGRGLFLEAAQERGHTVTGQDISVAAVKALKDRLNVPVHCGPVESLHLPHGGFDVIHANHVLEHIPDPGATLAALRLLLSPRGVLYVEVPRQSNLLNKLSGMFAGKEFGFTYHPGHLYLFSPLSLKLLLQRQGLSPMAARIEGMADPHRFVRGVHYHSLMAHLVKTVAGGLRLERLLGGGNLVVESRLGV